MIDAGTETGLFEVELKKLEYANLCASDIQPEMIKEAKKKKNDFICVSLSGPPIPQIETGQSDALICNTVNGLNPGVTCYSVV